MKCTGISILSLFENNKSIDELFVYVLTSDASDENKRRIQEISKNYNREIEFIDAKDKIESFAKSMELRSFRGSFGAYSSLIMDQIFKELDKLLVIDSDTLVVGSLEKLWMVNIDNELAAAVPEIGLYAKKSSSEDFDILYMSNYYFNTGVILYNLKKWREDKIHKILKTKIKDYGKEFKVVDQSIMNYAINDKIARLHLKYNYYTAVHGISFKTLCRHFSQKKVISKEEFYEARNNTVIIHFVGFPFERPWYKNGVTPYNAIYSQYLKKTPWASEPLESLPKSNSFIFGLYDFGSMFLRKLGCYNAYHWYRYILGQLIKQLIGKER
jgi:lipopolysaccharide biosynthesis glycosyltransferase